MNGPHNTYQFRGSTEDKPCEPGCDCPLCVPGPLLAAVVLMAVALVGLVILVVSR